MSANLEIEQEVVEVVRTPVEEAVAKCFYYNYGTDFRLAAIKSEARRALTAGKEAVRFFAQGLALGLGSDVLQAADPTEVLVAITNCVPSRD